MRNGFTWALPLLLSGCFWVAEPSPSDYVHGTEVGVIVHNYALAFRDFIRSEQPAGAIPSFLLSPLPLTDSEWHADDATSPVPVTTDTGAVKSESLTLCSAAACVRSIHRTYRDGFRIDEDMAITYRRGVTTSAGDDIVVGFHQKIRFRDQVESTASITEPAGGAPWVLQTVFSFPKEDIRSSLRKKSEYPELTSTAIPHSSTIDFKTRESRSNATYSRTGADWAYQQNVTYTIYKHLKGAITTFQVNDGAFTGTRELRYANGVRVQLFDVRGNETNWKFSGSTVNKGKTTGSRGSDVWRRSTQYPQGQRFKTLTDSGIYDGARGTFVRKIVGQKTTLTLSGKYRMKAPGIWELEAAGSGIRITLTYQPAELLDIFSGSWIQPNSRALIADGGDFLIYAQPDLTTLMTYTYNRSDTPFTPDENGVMRFVPDTRGKATVSVVQEKEGDLSRHVDYELGVVAEGQLP